MSNRPNNGNRPPRPAATDPSSYYRLGRSARSLCRLLNRKNEVLAARAEKQRQWQAYMDRRTALIESGEIQPDRESRGEDDG